MPEDKKIHHRKYSDEELLQYLRNNTSGEEANSLEKEMLDDPFLNDAVEGLQHYSSVNKISKDVHDINTKVRQQTLDKRKKRDKQLQNNWVLYLTFIIIIVLLIAFIFLQ